MSAVKTTAGDRADGEAEEVHATDDWALVVRMDGVVEARTHWDNGDLRAFTTAPTDEAPESGATYRYGKSIEKVLARYAHETWFDRDSDEHGAALRDGVIEALCAVAPETFPRWYWPTRRRHPRERADQPEDLPRRRGCFYRRHVRDVLPVRRRRTVARRTTPPSECLLLRRQIIVAVGLCPTRGPKSFLMSWVRAGASYYTSHALSRRYSEGRTGPPLPPTAMVKYLLLQCRNTGKHPCSNP